MAIKDKIIECISINLAKQKYGDPSKKDQCYIEAEELLKTLLLNVLIEKSKKNPLQYVEFLENVEELCDLDYYDVWFLESTIFGEWSRDMLNISLFLLKNSSKKYIYN